MALNKDTRILNRSLSVLLPVHNAQRTLENDVSEILDIVPELVSQFELLIIDDGSADGTWEVASDLSRRYPQVKVLRQSMRQGPAVAIHAGAKQTRGEIVIAHDGQPGIDAGEIASLLRDGSQSAVRPAHFGHASAVAPFSAPGTVAGPGAKQPSIIGIAARSKSSGFRLLRVGTIDELRRSVAAVNRLQWGGQPASELKQPQPAAISASSMQPSSPHSLQRPNFLARVKQSVRDFTLGE